MAGKGNNKDGQSALHKGVTGGLQLCNWGAIRVLHKHYNTPPLKVGARPRSNSMETEKTIFMCYQGNHHAIDLIGFVWEIIEFQHSKSITKSIFELQLHIALNQDILSDKVFKMAPWEPLQQFWGLCYDSYLGGVFWVDVATFFRS